MDAIAKTRWGDMPMTDDLEHLARELYKAKQSLHKWELYPFDLLRDEAKESWRLVARRAVELLTKERTNA